MERLNRHLAKPFVKWVGGKTQLLSDIKRALPKNLYEIKELTYVEPFVGGGAVLFWILQEFPNIKRAVINDINEELICTYRVIKSDVKSLIEELLQLQYAYLSLGDDARKEFFLSQRERYNGRRKTEVETAALFVFLNKTCFNGLYRVNSKGEFNVPHGQYRNPKICDDATLRSDSAILQRVEIHCGDFAEMGRYAGENVLYYLDPPYRPLSETSAFTSYSRGGFNDGEQLRLRDFCLHLTRHKSLFIASNSDPLNMDKEDYFFDEIYEQFAIRRVLAKRAINSRGAGRGPISEIMISNVANVSRY